MPITKTIKKFDVAYDSDSDVLYLCLSNQRKAASKGIEDKDGIVWRFDKKEELFAATIIDFYERWHDNQRKLAVILADRFGALDIQIALFIEDIICRLEPSPSVWH